MLRPRAPDIGDGVRPHLAPAWFTDLVQHAVKIITAYVECVIRNNAASIPRTQKKLLVVRFSHPGLDDIGLGKILREPLVMASIPASYRKKVGQPLIAFKYDRAIGTQWHNTRKYAHMSTVELNAIRTRPCNCHLIDDKYKRKGHLRTSDPSILPGEVLPKISSMGSKFRPSAVCNTLTTASKSDIRASLRSSVTNFARQADIRVNMTGCMNEWLNLVMQRMDHVLDTIPDGTCVQPTHPLTYTETDARMMHDFLSDKVCTSMDKAAGTIMFNCQKDYVTRIDNDLSSNSIYAVTSLLQGQIAQETNDFGSRYGFAPNPSNQEIPYYKGLDKMHKLPDPETRFISSSA